MAVPKQRHNSSRSKRRRAGHQKLTAPEMSACSNCNQMIQAHQACSNCGYYKGEQVIEIKSKAKKAVK
jgi:large subunit ribosomal protein L32